MYKPKTLLECKWCGDKIYSHVSGEFRECKCGKIFIDETEFYTRCGGEIESIIQHGIDERDFLWGVLNDEWDVKKMKEVKIRELELSHLENIITYLDDKMNSNKAYYISAGMTDRAERLAYGYMYYAVKNEITLRNTIKI